MADLNDFRLDNKDCERFLTLVENRLVDEQSWTESDCAFYVGHKNTCVECSKYDEMLSAFSDDSLLFPGDLDELGTENTASLETIRRVVDRRFARVRFRRWGFAAAAASILAAGVIGVVFALLNREAPEDVEAFGLAQGSLVIDGRNIGLGERFTFNTLNAEIPVDTLVEIPSKLYIAMEKDARVDFVEYHADVVRLRVLKGRAAIHLVPGSALQIQVEVDGNIVEVKGTVFVVEAGRAANSVQVVRGAVKVSRMGRQNAPPQTVEAGFKLTFENEIKAKTAPLRTDSLLALLGIVDNTPELPGTEGSASTEAPLEKVVSNAEMETASAASVPKAESLLRIAGECRAAKNWRCAKENFQKVVDHYPGLPDAATAMLPLAEILLENLDRPKEALQYFKRYQKRRPQSGLGQEALFGECRSLEKMGSTRQEKACLERYLVKYPNSLYTQMAKTRLMGIMVKD